MTQFLELMGVTSNTDTIASVYGMTHRRCRLSPVVTAYEYWQ